MVKLVSKYILIALWGLVVAYSISQVPDIDKVRAQADAMKRPSRPYHEVPRRNPLTNPALYQTNPGGQYGDIDPFYPLIGGNVKMLFGVRRDINKEWHEWCRGTE